MNTKCEISTVHPKSLSSLTVLLAAAFLCLFGQVFATASSNEKLTTFYVATNGRDTWSGMLAEPNPASTDGPLQTLTAARNAVHKLKEKSAGKLAAPVQVLLRGGKYFLAEPLELRAEDSGTRECPVTYAAYPGEKPILSGGRAITGWQPYKGKILVASLPEAKGGVWKLNQLFFNGQRQTCARWPNADPRKPWRNGWLAVEGAAEPQSYIAFTYKPGSFPRAWAKPTQGKVFMLINWGYVTITPIAKFDPDHRVIRLAKPNRCFLRGPWGVVNGTSDFGTGIGFRFYVENLLEELDQPGEWCVDTDDGKLYFWPPDGNTASHEVVAPVSECLIRLENASWITISGLTLTETANGGDNMHRFSHQGSGAMFPMEDRDYCGEAIYLGSAQHCSVVDNRFDQVGGNAVYLEGYNLKNRISCNEIAYAGHLGVGMIGNRDNRDEIQHPMANEVTDNYIHHCGVFDKVAPGVFCGTTDANLIAHNLIEQMPHHAINLGNDGYGRNIVEYNDIRNTCQESFDNAAINCWMENGEYVQKVGERSGHVFRYNRVADTPGDGTHGIYLDSLSSNCLVYGNIIIRSGSSGIRVNGGKNNIIENNIIVGPAQGISFYSTFANWAQVKGFMTGNRFCRNIVCGAPKTDAVVICALDKVAEDDPHVLADCDHNLFFVPDGGRPVISWKIEKMPLKDWQKNCGYDEHSIVADPDFVNPAKDDYRLRPGSPAWKLGFQPIDTSQIGPRMHAL